VAGQTYRVLSMAKKLTIKQLADIAWNIWESTQFYLQEHEIEELKALFEKELEAIKNAR
jgi:hypothetical protein